MNHDDVKQSRSISRLIDHAQTRIREWIAPLDRVAALVPKCDHLLELGCGQGILIKKLACRIPTITGVDYDERKCRMAKEQLCRDLPGITILQGDIMTFLNTVASDSIPCIVLADTLASNHPEDQQRILTECFRILARQGTLVLKIMDTMPWWKFKFSRMVSLLVYQVLRLSISSNQQLFYQSSTFYRDKMAEFGLSATIVPLHRQPFNPFSHTVILGVKE
ncbi:MAG: class I SAM-dependent methyltransferase [Magnetococcales bacterium]|nr:class I SAM-dependent methyltransferase [Magnetococcales bacterium]